MLQHFMNFHFETLVQKIYTRYTTFFSKNVIFLTVCFFFYLFWKFYCSLAYANFCNQGILINFGCIKFRKICKIPEKSTVRGGRYFLTFQPKDTLNCSNLNLNQYMLISIMLMKMMYLHFSQTETILVDNYIISIYTLPLVEMQTFLFMKD